MERVELLARAEGLPVAAGYVQVSVTGGEYRIYPSRGSRPRWVGRAQHVRFADGQVRALAVSELRTRRVKWLIGREV